MEKSLKKRVALGLAWLLAMQAFAQEAILRDISQAFAAAKHAQKPLLIYFSAVWCGPCRMVEKEILPHARFLALTDSFIRLKVIAASGEQSTIGGDSLARIYKVSSFPTFVLAEPDGKAYYTWVGVRGVNSEAAIENIENHLHRAAYYRRGEKPPDQLLQGDSAELGEGASPSVAALEHLSTIVNKADTTNFLQALGDYLKFFPDWCAAWEAPNASSLLLKLPKKGEYFRRWVWQHVDTLAQSLSETMWEELRERLIEAAYDSICEKVSFPSCTTVVYASGQKYASLLPTAPLLAKIYVANQLLESPDHKAKWEGTLLLVEAYEALYSPHSPILSSPKDSTKAFISYLLFQEVSDNLMETCPDTALLRIPVGWMQAATRFAPEMPLFWHTLAELFFYLRDKKSARAACQHTLTQAQKGDVYWVYGYFSIRFSVDEAYNQAVERLCERIERLPE